MCDYAPPPLPYTKEAQIKDTVRVWRISSLSPGFESRGWLWKGRKKAKCCLYDNHGSLDNPNSLTGFHSEPCPWWSFLVWRHKCMPPFHFMSKSVFPQRDIFTVLHVILGYFTLLMSCLTQKLLCTGQSCIVVLKASAANSPSWPHSVMWQLWFTTEKVKGKLAAALLDVDLFFCLHGTILAFAGTICVSVPMKCCLMVQRSRTFNVPFHPFPYEQRFLWIMFTLFMKSMNSLQLCVKEGCSYIVWLR